MRRWAQKRMRYSAYEKDAKRPRDELELTEAELGWARARARTDAEQAQRAQVLEQRLADLKRTVELRREQERLKTRFSRSRRKRATLPDSSPEAAKLDQQIAEIERQREHLRKELRFLRARETLSRRRDVAGARTRAERRARARDRAGEGDDSGAPGGHPADAMRSRPA